MTMRTLRHWLLMLCLLALTLGCAHVPVTAPGSTARETANPTALDNYVFKPDPAYAYTLVNTVESDGLTTYVLDMTSQSWRKPEEVDQTVWRHWLVVAVPEKVKTRTCLMIIGGGRNGNEAPKGANPLLRRAAMELGTVVAEIGQIPNQPLVFSDDGRKRSEDATIAYNWDKFLRTGEAEWLTRMPMTKAVVRAMDTVQTFCASPEGGQIRVDSFVTAGASKRGWTTWTTTIVDKRVIACVPMVIDLLNLVPSFRHHQAVYGGWAPAIDDYVEMNIMDWLNTPEFAAMLAIVDPYSYRDRLTMPKLLLNSAGDEFFLPDSWQFYLSDLKGPTWLRYVPNTGHGLGADAVSSVLSFYEAVTSGAEIPQYQWSFPDDCTIRVQTDGKPSVVKLWQATNPEARDFRIDTIGKAYTATELTSQGGGVYVGKVQKPEKGWTAFLVELTFPGSGIAPFVFTSPVRIVPDVTPQQYQPPAEAPKGFLSK
jgi:PhoPQ-activated pathogenicity-related protein